MVGDYHEAEDLAQTTVMRAYQAWGRFQGSDIRPWLFTIGLRLASNERRRRRRWLGRDARLDRTDQAPAAVDVDLWDALRKLRSSHRAALVVSVLDGYTHEEIADALGVESGTVGSWISRAKAVLRQELGEGRP